MQQTHDLRVRQMTRLVTPAALKAALPMTETVNRVVVESRQRVTRIIRREDPRVLVVVGPCSIHNVDAALEYARKLARARERLARTPQ